MKKFLLFIVIVVAAAAGGGYWFLTSGSINELVMEQIKVQGAKATGQAVGVAKVDIRVLDGAGSISGLTVANPPGYKQAYAFSLGTIGLEIDIASLTEEPYVIESILISNPEVFVEINVRGSNLKDLYEAIEKNMSTAGAVEPSSEGAGVNPRIRVNSLVLEGVAMTLDLTALGNKVHSEALPRVDLGGIGGAAGLPASQLGAVIAKEITDALWDEAKDKQKEKLRGKLKEKAVEELGKLLGKFKKD